VKRRPLHPFPAALVTLVGAAVLATMLDTLPTEALPQRTRGSDTLAVLFGDARLLLSRACVREADRYFHTGVYDDEAHAPEPAAAFDPWSWIDTHIQAPDVERHLSGREAVETLPWFVAAVKSDPRNIEAWSAAWYIAGHAMNDPACALRIAQEGRAANPENLELALCLARTYRLRNAEDHDAAYAALLDARRLAFAKTGGDLTRLDENDRDTFGSILGFLADEAAARADRAFVRQLLKDAAEAGVRPVYLEPIRRCAEKTDALK